MDVGSPMAISRHLILPAIPIIKENSTIKTEIDLTEDDTADEGKMPSFCVLLHGALKVENMAALVTVGENWFGFIYSWADSKKKSNLMLTILVPGSDAVPWLGDLNYLHCADNFSSESLSSFPVKPVEKRSYSQNSVVWIRQAGLQSDIQKILRHARKLPEKTQQFYKVSKGTLIFVINCLQIDTFYGQVVRLVISAVVGDSVSSLITKSKFYVLNWYFSFLIILI